MAQPDMFSEPAVHDTTASAPGHQGKYDEAGKLSRRALEGYGKELDEQHSSTYYDLTSQLGTDYT